ncbi:MAG: GDP-mannose 4,6-dehydratase, partial [Bryobacteraceae bacterium]|nr:GDP-mannose 4,6-dehydratase [Bryobacteraceae bacterium]
IHASTGILFNHESPRRGHEFVTRKITSGIAAIAAGRQTELRLGNLDAYRDWGHARDYVEAMWLMLQRDEPEDYVIATGVTHSVREFVELAFSLCGLEPYRYIVIDPVLFRPAETLVLTGDPRKADRLMNWRASTRFEGLVQEMIEADCRAADVEITTTSLATGISQSAVT